MVSTLRAAYRRWHAARQDRAAAAARAYPHNAGPMAAIMLRTADHPRETRRGPHADR